MPKILMTAFLAAVVTTISTATKARIFCMEKRITTSYMAAVMRKAQTTFPLTTSTAVPAAINCTAAPATISSMRAMTSAAPAPRLESRMCCMGVSEMTACMVAQVMMCCMATMTKTVRVAAATIYTGVLAVMSSMADRVTTICMPARIKTATVINRRIP